MSHNPFGGNGTDSFNQTTTQILLNSRQRRGFSFAVFNNLELLTVLKMVGSMGAIKPRTSQLELYVRLSPHTAPELLGD